MASTLPVNFQIVGEGAVSSYDWFDFATGAGYKTFYCVGGYNSVAKQYFLNTNAMESDELNRSVQIGATTADLDFDLTFSRPITVAAAAAYFRASCTTGTATCYITVNVYHVTSGGTETSIGQGITTTMDASSTEEVFALKFDLTKKAFAIGEKLRVNVILTSSANFSTMFYDAGTSGKQMSIQIPFEVQI